MKRAYVLLAASLGVLALALFANAGTTVFPGDVRVDGTLTPSGAVTAGSVSTNGTLQAAGATALNGNVTLTAGATNTLTIKSTTVTIPTAGLMIATSAAAMDSAVVSIVSGGASHSMNVGIGKAAPDYDLDVADDAKVGDQLIVMGTASFQGGGASNASLVTSSFAAVGYQLRVFDTNTPNDYGVLQMATNKILRIRPAVNNTGTLQLESDTGGSTYARMRMTNAGLFGFGTDQAPVAKLHMSSGNILLDGNAYSVGINTKQLPAQAIHLSSGAILVDGDAAQKIFTGNPTGTFEANFSSYVAVGGLYNYGPSRLVTQVNMDGSIWLGDAAADVVTHVSSQTVVPTGGFSISTATDGAYNDRLVFKDGRLGLGLESPLSQVHGSSTARFGEIISLGASSLQGAVTAGSTAVIASTTSITAGTFSKPKMTQAVLLGTTFGGAGEEFNCTDCPGAAATGYLMCTSTGATIMGAVISTAPANNCAGL